MKIITFIITLIIKTIIIVITYCSLSLSLAYLWSLKKTEHQNNKKNNKHTIIVITIIRTTIIQYNNIYIITQ